MAKTSRLAKVGILLGIVSLVTSLLGVLCFSFTFGQILLGLSFLGSIATILLGAVSFVVIILRRRILRGGKLSVGAVLVGLVVFIISKPGLMPDRRAAWESATVGWLRTITAQEDVFKGQCEVDQDADGIGEYGWLNELCAASLPRRRDDGSTPVSVSPVYLSGASVAHYFAERDIACTFRRSHYSVVIFLPFPQRGAMDDRVLDGVSSFLRHGHLVRGKWSTPLDPAPHRDIIDLQERHFVAYAVPVVDYARWREIEYEVCPWPKGRSRFPRNRWHRPGRYTYVVNEKGEVYCTAMEHRKYEWLFSHVTDYRAAFVDDGSTDTIFNNPLADGQKGFDGNVWHRLKK